MSAQEETVTFVDALDAMRWLTEDMACHCGKPVHIHEDLDGFSRGLCKDCDAVRCDAYPGECGRR